MQHRKQYVDFLKGGIGKSAVQQHQFLHNLFHLSVHMEVNKLHASSIDCL